MTAAIPTPARRLSTQAETTLKELLQEMLKIQDKIEKKIEDSQEKTQQNMEKLFKDEMGKLRQEMKEDMAQIQKEVSGVQEEIKDLKKDNANSKKKQAITETKIKRLEEARDKLERQQELWACRETDFQLRFRNIEETEGENLRETIAEITMGMLNTTMEEMNKEIDTILRVNSNYARRNKVPRDIVATFCRRSVRDEIIKMKPKDQITFKGRKVIILKEFSTMTMNKRKKYYFLTDELKKHRIKFRWERLEGIQVTYKDNKFWLTSEEKAKEFHKTLLKDLETTPHASREEESNKTKYETTEARKQNKEWRKEEKKRPRPESLEDEVEEKDMGPSQHVTNPTCDE
nr:uncharacterized protein PF3D7_1120000-like [Anolis sagrei ordinatus]